MCEEYRLEFYFHTVVQLSSQIAFVYIFCQAGGAEEGSREALWGAAA